MIKSGKRLLLSIVSIFMVVSMLTCEFSVTYAYASYENTDELSDTQYSIYEDFVSVTDNENSVFSDGWFIAQNNEQDLSAYKYLKNYLMTYGKKSSSSNSYYISELNSYEGNEYFFSITYDADDADLHCGATLLNSTLYIFLTFDSKSSDGYKVTSVSINEEYNYTVHGRSVVYPENYTDTIKFTNYDDDGYIVNNSALDNLLNTAFNLCVNEWNDMLEQRTTINFGNFGFVKLFTPETITGADSYTVYYDANGGSDAPASQTKSKDESLAITDKIPTRYGYIFVGWAIDNTAVSALYQPGDLYTDNNNIILYAVWERNEIIQLTPTVRIENNPKIVTISYYSTVYLTAVPEYLPEGATLQWFLNDSTVSSVTGNRAYYSNPAQDATLTVKIIDSEGKPVVDEYGNEIKDTIIIDVETGFFNLIASFFRFLFSGSKKIVI